MRDEKLKGIQTVMLMFIVAIVIGLMVFSVYILFGTEMVQGGGGVTFFKWICGYFNTIIGGIFGAGCNL